MVENKMGLELMYITNNPNVASIAQKYGVDRIWIDMEYKGKDERQKGLDSVKNHHTIADIKNIRPIIKTSKLLVRVNPLDKDSKKEINEVIESGADIIMLPMWKNSYEVKEFLKIINKRCKTVLLLETKEAVECIDEVLKLKDIEEIHIGLNDLHLSYGLKFMFELLSDGTVEMLCKKFKNAGIKYGFGGISKIGCGDVPAELIIVEHYRLGSTRAILSRNFCDTKLITDINEIEKIFSENLKKLRAFENEIQKYDNKKFLDNKEVLDKKIFDIVNKR